MPFTACIGCLVGEVGLGDGSPIESLLASALQLFVTMVGPDACGMPFTWVGC